MAQPTPSQPLRQRVRRAMPIVPTAPLLADKLALGEAAHEAK